MRTISNENTPCREAVGSLLYLANATRPDISYSVKEHRRHQMNPTDDDWRRVERVFRYLKRTSRIGLTYLGQKENLQSYSDASFADRKNLLTTGGYLIQSFGDTIAWKTHKQNYVALSTCEAEYLSMSEAGKDLIATDNSLY